MSWNINLIIPILGWLIFTVAFCIYSFIGLGDLKNYGYVGDACQKVRLIYIIISIMVILITIFIFILI